MRTPAVSFVSTQEPWRQSAQNEVILLPPLIISFMHQLSWARVLFNEFSVISISFLITGNSVHLPPPSLLSEAWPSERLLKSHPVSWSPQNLSDQEAFSTIESTLISTARGWRGALATGHSESRSPPQPLGPPSESGPSLKALDSFPGITCLVS